MKSSTTKRGGKTCFDRISSLPDELIGHILSFLPTRCTVHTSILSTRRRYLLCLVFTREYEKIVGGKERFKEFVCKVFKLHQISPIKKSSLVYRGTYKKSDLNTWVTNTVQKGVQEVHYQANDFLGDLPDGLVVCETLVRLELKCYTAHPIKIPLSTSLPSLKILHLDNVMFLDQFSIERLFSSSKVLEELTLYSCGSFGSGHGIISARRLKVLRIEKCDFNNLEDGFLEIDAPNLAYLIYKCNIGVKIVPSWKYTCSLVKAELNFGEVPYISDSHSVEYDREIFKTAAYKTTDLSLFSNPVELLLEQMPVFHILSKLHLCHVYAHSWKYVTSLLDKSPQLKTVIFEKGLLLCNHCLVSLPPSEPFSFLVHLLKNARFLKKLIVCRCRCSDAKKKKVRIPKDLIMKLPRASKDLTVVVLN